MSLGRWLYSGSNVGPVETAGINLDRVTQWLIDNIDGVEAPFAFHPIAGGHSNLTFEVTDGSGRKLVLRRPPLAAVLATAHDMVREHRVISAFGNTPVACPRTLGLCTDETVNDAPFYVMDFVEGVVLHDQATAAARLPMEQRVPLSESVIDTLAALHTADPDAIGLGDLGRRSGYLERQLKRWQGQWEKTKTRELPAMDRTYELLLDAQPEERYNTVVHGDYRLGNMLITPETGQVAAVLDWELCTLGDPLADLGYLLNGWVEPGEADQIAGATDYPTADGGFMPRGELISRYVQMTGFEVDNPDYYRAFQFWRLGAIVEGVLSRYMKGALDNDVDLDAFGVQIDWLAGKALELAEGM
ncbi:MAG: phosphotransferase family protein [Acidimicrobiia bacterium]|nr:phosphotransferase family protein [Acidimicrobiia bacterium]